MRLYAWPAEPTTAIGSLISSEAPASNPSKTGQLVLRSEGRRRSGRPARQIGREQRIPTSDLGCKGSSMKIDQAEPTGGGGIGVVYLQLLMHM